MEHPLPAAAIASSNSSEPNRDVALTFDAGVTVCEINSSLPCLAVSLGQSIDGFHPTPTKHQQRCERDGDPGKCRKRACRIRFSPLPNDGNAALRAA